MSGETGDGVSLKISLLSHFYEKLFYCLYLLDPISLYNLYIIIIGVYIYNIIYIHIIYIYILYIYIYNIYMSKTGFHVTHGVSAPTLNR